MINRGFVIIGLIIGFIAIVLYFFFSTAGDVSKKTNSTVDTIKDTYGTVLSTASPQSDSVAALGRGAYTPYTQQDFDKYTHYKRVLFFNASWCPTCKEANQEFTNKFSKIPHNVVVLSVDYDKEAAIKQKYGITYQHTFVQVDENGNELTKWNGGGIDQLKSKVQ